jgi:hypothetical protein
VEEYARHREEEKEILRMTEEHRQEMERENRKLDATDLARLQERVSTDLARLQERVSTDLAKLQERVCLSSG